MAQLNRQLYVDGSFDRVVGQFGLMFVSEGEGAGAKRCIQGEG